jgi:hypothetical protein
LPSGNLGYRRGLCGSGRGLLCHGGILCRIYIGMRCIAWLDFCRLHTSTFPASRNESARQSVSFIIIHITLYHKKRRKSILIFSRGGTSREKADRAKKSESTPYKALSLFRLFFTPPSSKGEKIGIT